MKTTDELVRRIVEEFKAKGYAQVEGYYRFGFVEERLGAVVVSRQTGRDTTIRYRKIAEAVEAVRSEPAVYNAGPSSLRAHGIKFIDSPLWALLALLPLSELTE